VTILFATHYSIDYHCKKNQTLKTIFKACILINLLPGVSSSLIAQNFEWAKSFGGGSDDYVQSISLDSLGNIYTIGIFQETVDFDPGMETASLSSSGGFDVFVQKMDASGNFIWAKSFGSAHDDYGRAISVDGSGNVYIAGSFYGTIDFDPGEDISNLTSTDNNNIFVQKMDSSGNFLWARSFGNTNYDKNISICADASGNVYTRGDFGGVADFDPGVETSNLTSLGDWDIFVQKMDASGNFLWARSFGSSHDDSAHSMGIDISGNVYTVGNFYGTLDFDPEDGTAEFTSIGSYDAFVQKMDPSGHFLWAKTFGGSGYDHGQSISVDSFGNVYSIGHFQNTIDFDTGAGLTNLTSSGGYDVFVQKMDDSGNILWAKSYGGTAHDYAYSISVDSLGNVYSTGTFSGIVDFDPGAGTTNIFSSNSSIFVQKLDASGNFLWAKSFGGSLSNSGRSNVADNSGHVYTIGIFASTVDFDPDAGVTYLASNGGYDIFVHKIGQPTIDVTHWRDNGNCSVYPNPTQGNVEITLGSIVQDVELMLTDIQGRVIYTRNYPSLFKTNIELPEAKGVYVLKLRAQDSTSTLRLVKE